MHANQRLATTRKNVVVAVVVVASRREKNYKFFIDGFENKKCNKIEPKLAYMNRYVIFLPFLLPFFHLRFYLCKLQAKNTKRK